jgi:hypothetical protein
MEKKKIVSVNLDAIKEKAAEAVRAVGDRAGRVKDRAVAALLDRGIKLSEKQLKALEQRRKAAP